MSTLRGQVAIVLDAEQIAINKGSNDGVAIGDTVTLLREVKIPDPTRPGTFLGTAFVKKGSLTVESVHDKFSVARVEQVRSNKNSGLLFAGYERAFSMVDNPMKEGEKRIHVKVGTPVDVFISDEIIDATYR